MCLKEFRKAGGNLTAYPLHKVVCAGEDSVLMVLGYLLKMLPQGVSIKISPPMAVSGIRPPQQAASVPRHRSVHMPRACQ